VRETELVAVIDHFAMRLPAAREKKQGQARGARARPQARSVRILKALHGRLKRQASKLQVPEWMLTRYLLERGLQEVSQGRLVLAPRLQAAGLTLYPHEKLVRPKRKGPETKVVSHRHFPEELHQALKQLAETKGVPLWQVLSYLLEDGLERIRQGHLQVETHPVATTTQTLYPREAK
jgi:predicted DNA-binding protein